MSLSRLTLWVYYPGDLKKLSILLGQGHQAKLAAFGLALQKLSTPPDFERFCPEVLDRKGLGF